MFEKCGLRDIFAKIVKMKWVILILLIVFAGIGTAFYMKDVKAEEEAKAQAEAENRTMYAGYAFYYINYTKEGVSPTNSLMKSTAVSYIRTMGLYPTRAAIFKVLTEKHTKEELVELLDSKAYAKGITRFNIKRSYTISRDTNSPYILKLRVTAEDSAICKELLNACKDKLIKIDKGIKNSSLKYEGNYIVAEKTNGSDEEGEEKKDSTAATGALTDKIEDPGPTVKTIIIWLVIGLMIGLILAVLSALIRPVINRASDFEAYGTLPIGEAGTKQAPIFARLLNKRFESENMNKIVFATSRKKDKKIEETCRSLAEEWTKLGKEVHFGEEAETGITIQVAYAPDQNAEASDLCQNADMVIATERKGASAHKRYDEMLHYLGLMDIKPAGAVLFN